MRSVVDLRMPGRNGRPICQFRESCGPSTTYAWRIMVPPRTAESSTAFRGAESLLRAGKPERAHQRAPFFLLGADIGPDLADRLRIEGNEPEVGHLLDHVGGRHDSLHLAMQPVYHGHGRCGRGEQHVPGHRLVVARA